MSNRVRDLDESSSFVEGVNVSLNYLTVPKDVKSLPRLRAS